VAFSHKVEVSGNDKERLSKKLPRKGVVEPHPWGERWVSEMRSAANLLVKMDSQFNLGSIGLPLVARHCSDGDIKGELSLKAWY